MKLYIISLVTASWPVLSSNDYSQQAISENDAVNIVTGHELFGLTTFANLPYLHCISMSNVDAYDIAILGAPFDTVGPISPFARPL